jgi:hypothetical protein
VAPTYETKWRDIVSGRVTTLGDSAIVSAAPYVAEDFAFANEVLPAECSVNSDPPPEGWWTPPRPNRRKPVAVHSRVALE